MKKIQIFLTLFFILFFDQSLFSQTTGKISGKVIDGESKTLLLGANVILLPTQSGISTDDKGLFNLINVRPGNYSIKVMMIGYETVIIEDVIVSVNRTTSLDIKMNQTTLEGQEVVIYATKFSRKKDQTGTVKNISSDEIILDGTDVVKVFSQPNYGGSEVTLSVGNYSINRLAELGIKPETISGVQFEKEGFLLTLYSENEPDPTDRKVNYLIC